MSYVPVKLPAGVYKHGTELDSAGRWIDANLVRWQNGSLRPMGGWISRASAASTYAPRGMLAWVDNSHDEHIALGSYEKLYSVSASGTVSDITPAGFTSGALDAEENIYYGGGFYDVGDYGVQRPTTNLFQECSTWALDTWGENLVGCMCDDGKLYEWSLVGATPAAVITNAPVNNKSLVVTEERFIFALASGGNPRKVAWCDREDNTTWTPTATNEAGDIELQTSGEIMQGLRVRGRTLIITNEDAHIATYQGAPTVYGFERIGTACGAVSRKSAASVQGGAFWMGRSAFFMYDGSSVQKMPCDISDYVFKDINNSQQSKVFSVHNSQHGEVWWFYPSESSVENDRYAVYNYAEGYWNIGYLGRTSGVDLGVFNAPIWADASGNLYDHETGFSHGSSSVYAETAPITFSQSSNITKIIGMIPDEATQGEVTVTFKTRFHPNDTEYTYGTYSMANPTSVRCSGRQIRMVVNGIENADWRVGTMRLDIIEGGKR